MGMKARATAKGVKAAEGVRSAPRGDNDGGIAVVEDSRPAPAGPIILDAKRDVPNIQGASGGDVKQYSETEPLAEAGLQKSIENAARVSKIMEKKNREGGKKVYVCPFCKHQFDDKSTPALNKKACQKHINEEHEMSVKAAKLSNKKNAKKPGFIKEPHEPREKIVAPVLDPRDLVAPEHRRFYNSQTPEFREETRTIRERSTSLRSGRLGGHFNVNQYLTQTEQACIAGLPRLSLEQLKQVARVADTKGRRLLTRAARKAADVREADASKQ